MNSLRELLLGVISVASFAFALWRYHESRVTKETEKGKIAASAQRIRQASSSARIIAYSADLIVQRCKQQDVPLSEVQNLARTVRANAIVLLEELRREKTRLEDWKYGKLVLSEMLPEDSAAAAVDPGRDSV